MLHCNLCRRWVHLECDKPTDHELDSQVKEDYICLYCKHLAAEMDPFQPGVGMDMTHLDTDYSNEMEVEGSEAHVVFLKNTAGTAINGQDSEPGIVPEAAQMPTDEQWQRSSPQSPGTPGLPLAEASQDKVSPEVENLISHEAAASPQHVCHKTPSGNEVGEMEDTGMSAHQTVIQPKKLDYSEDPQVVLPPEAAGPAEQVACPITVLPEASVPSGEDSTALLSKDLLAITRAHEKTEQTESSGPSVALTDLEITLPPMESHVKEGSGPEDGPGSAPLDLPSAFLATAISPPPTADLPSPGPLPGYPATLPTPFRQFL